MEGCFWDPGFELNTVRDSGKRTFHGRQDLTATRKTGTNDVGFVCRKFGKLIVLAANANFKTRRAGSKASTLPFPFFRFSLFAS